MARRKEHHPEHHDERWLLTYADMITLLMALFIVLFSISSVNKSKFEGLQRSFKEAFSGGKVLPGGSGIKDNGGSAADAKVVALPLSMSIQPTIGGGTGKTHGGNRAAETKEFQRLKSRIDAFTREKGLQGRVRTRITDDGLEIRVLTDKLLFASGSAVPQPAGIPLLHQIGQILAPEKSHHVNVEGHTDDVPIRTGQFPSNWELSGSRASAVVRALAQGGVGSGRMTAQGRAQLDPVTSNDTDAGRVLNRRVEILLPRMVTR
jgi:chemotaxis protein MotB